MTTLEGMRERCDACGFVLEAGQIGKCGQRGQCQATRRELPPDPEGTNDRRAGWAGEAIRKFQRETSCEDDEMLGDLLCDLMHWCDRNNQDFEAALDRARANYDAETREG